MSTAAVNPRCFPIPASSICGSLSQHSSNSLLSFDGSQASGVFNSLRLTLPANLSAGVFGSAADLDWALEQTLPSSTAATSTADTAFTQWNCQHQQVQLMQVRHNISIIDNPHSHIPPHSTETPSVTLPTNNHLRTHCRSIEV